MAHDAQGRARDLPGELVVLVEPIAGEQGIELVDVEVKGPPNRRVVRLVADAADGLDLDRIASLSRAVGDVLDDAIKGSYTLEVTSPGTDRPLHRGRDFARHIGRDVRVHRTEAAAQDAPAEVTGTVAAAADDTVTLTVDGTDVVIPLDEVDHGIVVLPW